MYIHIGESNYILYHYLLQGCPNNIYLILENVNFPNRIMYNTWLHVTAQVKHLTINNCAIGDIQDDSFSSDNFEYLKTLTFINMKTSHFNESIFNGLDSITDLNLRKMSKKLKLDANFLQAFTSLQTLQIQESIYDTNSLTRLTGSETFGLLRIQLLDLTYNKLTTIPANAFRSNSLISLYLGSNMLSTIDDNAFQYARNIQLLHLASNHFKTLSNRPFVIMGVLRTLYIQQNDWECNCDLQWMKKFHISDGSTTICANGEHFDKVDFCAEENQPTTMELSSSSSILTTPSTSNNPSVTSTTISTTFSSKSTTTASASIPTTISSTTNDPSTMFPTTLPSKSSTTSTSISIPTTPSTSSDTSETLTTLFTILPLSSTTAEDNPGIMKQMQCIKNKMEHRLYNFRLNINMTATNEGDGNIRMTVHTANVNPTKYDFVMINSDLAKDTCYILDNFSATEVNLDDSYTVCMVDKLKHTLTSPLDCVSVRSPLPQQAESQSWLRDEHKVPFIFICLAVVLLLVGLTAVSMFYCIRQHPQLLKGNKRVVVVKNSSADVLVMPPRQQVPLYVKTPRLEYATNMEYMPPRRYIQRRDPDYLTPVISRNACQRPRPPLMRSLSDTSVKTIASYITENQMDMNYAARRELEEIEVPPPLPPPRREYSKYDYSNEIFVYKEY